MNFVRRVFYGPIELRAGWRLVIFLLFFMLVGLAELVLLRLVAGSLTSQQGRAIGGLLGTLVPLLVAGVLMAKFEGRKMADYGLPWRQSLGKQFWQGAIFGFATMTAVVAALHLAGVLSFTEGTLEGSAIWVYSIGYALYFLAGALLEEFSCRGYLLFTLTTGLGFWPAAVLSSILFGLLHATNPGETFFGCLSTSVFGFLFCVILRRTGNLWMPIGFHAAYNWSEAFFYGTPDSGLLAPERFRSATLEGANWLTGGTAGPEGSYLCVAIIALVTVGFAFWQREKRFPDPAALRQSVPPDPSAPLVEGVASREGDEFCETFEPHGGGPFET
jgi:uncharacterized protein